MSPALFNYYLADIPLPPQNIKLIMYTDDITIYISGPVVADIINGPTSICRKWLLLLSTPLHQRAASRVQHPNHVAANSLSPQMARKGSTLSGFVQRSRLEREVGRDLHSNKWEEV